MDGSLLDWLLPQNPWRFYLLGSDGADGEWKEALPKP